MILMEGRWWLALMFSARKGDTVSNLQLATVARLLSKYTYCYENLVKERQVENLML